MKCLECKYAELIEHGCKGYLGETIVKCNMCNEINGQMEDCKDFEDKDREEVTLKDALRIIGNWIAGETHKRKYPETDLIELSKALIILKQYVGEVE